ncbi:MAG TPA: hypothetical protein DCW60_02350 [Sutterella sp.]|nr:hypothetical protein [Sutterella sp.]
MLRFLQNYALELTAIAICILLAAFFTYWIRVAARRAAKAAKTPLSRKIASFWGTTEAFVMLMSINAAGFVFAWIVAAPAFRWYPKPGPYTIDRLFAEVAIALFGYLVLQNFFIGSLGPKVFGKVLRALYAVIFWVIAAIVIAGMMPVTVKTLSAITLPIASGKVDLWEAMAGTITVIFCLCAANWLARLTTRAVEAAHEMTPNAKIVLARLLRIAIYALAVVFALGVAGIDLTVLSVLGGAIGVGVGFGLQKIAANYISGFIILADKSVKIGDLVEVSGFNGTVKEINTRYSVIRNLAAEELIVPNENFITGAFKNLSYTETSTVQSIVFTVAYGADVNAAIDIAIEAVGSQAGLLPDKKPSAYVSALGDDGVDITVWFWVAEPQKGTARIRSGAYRAALDAFKAKGIDIPYQTRDIHVSGSLAINKGK